MKQYRLSQLNQITQSEFIEALGAIFEASPWVAEQAWLKRPFPDVDTLHQTMVDVVNHNSSEQQLMLIRAHPDLGTKAKMAEASVREQSGVGLDRLSSSEYERFQTLNQNYKDKFGFPFIIAVKNQMKESILEAFEQRLKNSVQLEQETALKEIAKIAKFRLEDTVLLD